MKIQFNVDGYIMNGVYFWGFLFFQPFLLDISFLLRQANESSHALNNWVFFMSFSVLITLF